MHLHSSPAYSISTSVKQSISSLMQTWNRRIPCLVNHPMMVGPGSYATDKVVSLLHNPSWKYVTVRCRIGTDKRDHTLKSETPGPGSY